MKMSRVLVGVKRVIDYAVKVSEILKVIQRSAENFLSEMIMTDLDFDLVGIHNVISQQHNWIM